MKNVLHLLQLARAHWRLYLVAFVALTAATTLFLVVPRRVGDLVELLPRIADTRTELTVGMFRPAIDIGILLILQALCAALYSYLVANASERIANDLRASFFRNLISQPLDEASPRQLGRIASEFSSDLGLIQGGLSETLFNFLRHAIFTAGAIGALLFVDAGMTVVAVGGVAIIAFVILLFIRKATKAVIAVQNYRSRTVALLLEAASNVYVIQAYERIDYMAGRFAERLGDTFARVKRHLVLMTMMNPISMLVFAMIVAGTLAFGITRMRAGHLSLADLVSYITYALVLVASVSQLGVLAGRLQQAGAMLVKHEGLLLQRRDPAAALSPLFHPRAAVVSEPVPAGRIAPPFGYALENVVFQYPDTEQPALAGVSFRIPSGEVTAIIGSSGAGKSTIAGLLCGIYRPTSGSVRFVDGASGGAAVPPLRHEIAVVPQEPFLFAGTIAENIGFGRPNVTAADIERAARTAQIHEHIRSLPGGYEAGIDEGGRNMSRGQRQRLALARALATRPRALILDEATASVDVVSERAIKQAIQALRGQVTIVIVAHQGELLADVDNLIVLDHGRVLSAGAPESNAASDVLANLTALHERKRVEA